MTRFIDFAYKATSGITPRTDPDRWVDGVRTEEFGAIADSNSHPLSSRYVSLAQAQTDYPFVTSLAQEIDWAACKQASNVAFGADGSENGNNSNLNKVLLLGEGIFFFGNDTWTIRNLQSGRILGEGQFVTQLKGNSIVLQFDGVWFSVLESFSIEAVLNTAITALDIDGNVPGHPYPTRGVQGVDLVNVSALANGGQYAFALCRQGGSGAQGSECQYRDLHLQGATTACYYQNGFNALSNIFLGGDMQSYTTNGILANGGTVHVLGTSFESTVGFTQYLNNGYDINIGATGSQECCIIHGCRSESMRFLLNSGAVTADVRGCVGLLGTFNQWTGNIQWNVNDAIVVPASKQIFKVTVAGVAGGVQPSWPATGSVVDGGVTWTFVDFNYIENQHGFVEYATCSSNAGSIKVNRYGNGQLEPVTSAYTVTEFDNIIFVDATSAPITITLPTPIPAERHRTITIKKVDTSANAVTVVPSDTTSSGARFEGGGVSDTIAGGSRGWRTYSFNNEPAGTSPPWWYTISTG